MPALTVSDEEIDTMLGILDGVRRSFAACEPSQLTASAEAAVADDHGADDLGCRRGAGTCEGTPQFRISDSALMPHVHARSGNTGFA
jgi:hypothetical protein